jgi:hypothetical protein
MGESAVSAANAGTSAIQNQTSALEQNIAAREKAIDLARREIEVSNQEKGLTKDGWVADDNGQKIIAGSQVNSALGIINYLKNTGLTQEQAVKLAEQFIDDRGNPKWNGTGWKDGSKTPEQSLNDASAKVMMDAGDRLGSSGATRTVNVNLNLPGGGTKTVAVQGDAAAQALIDALKQAGLTSS